MVLGRTRQIGVKRRGGFCCYVFGRGDVFGGVYTGRQVDHRRQRLRSRSGTSTFRCSLGGFHGLASASAFMSFAAFRICGGGFSSS